jgi:hypothetical protein
MPICPWCEKPATTLVEQALPDDDYIEICVDCALKEEEKYETRHSQPRLKTIDRTYARS